eukprot:m.908307 g.908307  ORF g.908307 m.908307 type:complete len:111 (+) comp60100_c0_seq3:634-966(+)
MFEWSTIYACEDAPNEAFVTKCDAMDSQFNQYDLSPLVRWAAKQDSNWQAVANGYRFEINVCATLVPQDILNNYSNCMNSSACQITTNNHTSAWSLGVSAQLCLARTGYR